MIDSAKSLAHKRHALVAAVSAASQFGSSRMNIVSSEISLGSSLIVDSHDDSPSGCGSGVSTRCSFSQRSAMYSTSSAVSQRTSRISCQSSGWRVRKEIPHSPRSEVMLA